MNNEDKEVFVAVPSRDKWSPYFGQSLVAGMMFMQNLGVRCRVANEISGNLPRNLNTLTLDFLNKSSASHIVYINDDIKFPPFAINWLTSHDACDVIGAAVRQRTTDEEDRPYTSWKETRKVRVGIDDLRTDYGPLEVERIGWGLVSVKREVIEALDFPYFYNKGGVRHNEFGQKVQYYVGEDYVFSDQVREKGFKLWIDRGVSLHIEHEMSVLV